jgi:two-component system cell cycle response regulator DivK
MRILIAEDEELNQAVIMAMVELIYDGVSVTVVGDGAQALEELKRETYDLVLTDIDMPLLDGYKLLEEIRGLNLTVPLICVTAYAVSGDREKLLLHGFDDYISKPIDMYEMKKVLDRYIDA